MRKQFAGNYQAIISVENLLEAWKEFLKGKRDKKDVQEFGLHLMDNVLELHCDLSNNLYDHGAYQAFSISDPKPRNIHKATVRDRLLHRAIYRILYPFFEKTFITDSYSCRDNKGVHRALNRFREFAHRVSKNHTKGVWVLKCDVGKFFASIDHGVLLEILGSYISQPEIFWLLEKVIKSYRTKETGQLYGDRHIAVEGAKGLPLGNLTSQLFCNVYMNELDQFVKHKLKAKYYIRYADDLVILSDNYEWLMSLLDPIGRFLAQRLGLTLHENKVEIGSVASGLDFLGWKHFTDLRVLRKATRRRMMKRFEERPSKESLQSYLGLLGHGNTQKLRRKLRTAFILSQE